MWGDREGAVAPPWGAVPLPITSESSHETRVQESNPEAGWGQSMGSSGWARNSRVPWALRTSAPVPMGRDSRGNLNCGSAGQAQHREGGRCGRPRRAPWAAMKICSEAEVEADPGAEGYHSAQGCSCRWGGPGPPGLLGAGLTILTHGRSRAYGLGAALLLTSKQS